MVYVATILWVHRELLSMEEDRSF